jgi:site-specific DNA recombinase
MGYDVRDRQLVVNEADAATIRRIFAAYLEAGDVPTLMARLAADSVLTTKRHSAKGNHSGARTITRGHLYKLWTNPIYIGRVPHKGATHAGQHQGIIDKELWEAVQKQLASNVQGPRARRGRADREASMLAGVLVSAARHPFVESHANKGSRRYRYYVEDAKDLGRPRAASLWGDKTLVRMCVLNGLGTSLLPSCGGS